MAASAAQKNGDDKQSGTISTIGEQANAVVDRQQFNAVREMNSTATDFASALAELEAAGIKVDTATAENLGDGYATVDKAKLVNRKLIFQQWLISAEKNEKYDSPYVVIRGMTLDGLKFRITDGSRYGLCAQLIDFTSARVKANHPAPNSGLICEEGLQMDVVEYENEDGSTGEGKIFRINV